METPNSTLSSPPVTYSSSDITKEKIQNSNFDIKTPTATVSRLWRPAAQRNLKNQWMKLASHKQKWVSASSTGRTHATSLVNAHLSERYVPLMDLGVLSDMPLIREKACMKLAGQQELYWKKLISCYRDMVGVVSHMVNDSQSMRCYMKGPSGSPLIQFSSHSESKNDLGDGGGIPVFTFWSLSTHEKLGQELVQMFASELVLKRLIVLELLCISCQEQQTDKPSWSIELYLGEFEDLRLSGLYCEESRQPVLPRINGHASDTRVSEKSNIWPDREVLEVYLTTWLVEVNIDTHRMEDIFSIVGEEMHVNIS